MKDLPKFPNFRLFTADDISWCNKYYLDNSLNPYVDINPENMFVWLGINDDLMISELNDILILRYTNILNDNQINIIPLAKTLNDHIVELMMSYLRDNNLPLELHEIPSTTCQELDHNKWIMDDDRNNYEYILNTKQQSSLEGSDFSRQRRRINFFEREHMNDNVEVKYYAEVDDSVRDAFLYHINTKSLNSSEQAAQHNTNEPKAIRKNLKYAPILHKKALFIKINDVIASLSMISYLDGKTAAINHLKVDYSIQYIFQYTIYSLAKILCEGDIKEMNIEQDLGIEGLRTFKERMQPSRMLEKKTIRPRYQ